MYTQKHYKQMVVYVEACESGSMFENILPNNINGEQVGLRSMQWDNPQNSVYSQNVFQELEQRDFLYNMDNNKYSLSLLVYTTTASNADESSYACYYDAALETYLGDCYSVNWMENVDSVSNYTAQAVVLVYHHQ